MNSIGFIKRFLNAFFLLTISVVLSAFIDSEYFKSEFQWQALVSQYEAKGPSGFYREMSGIEVEGFYTERPGMSFQRFADLNQIIPSLLPNFKTIVSTDSAAEKVRSLFVYRLNGIDQKLGIHIDDSIRHPLGTQPIEIVSPVLASGNDIDVYISVLKKLSIQSLLTAEPLHSGTHFHFDFLHAERTEVLILTVLLDKLFPEIVGNFNIQSTRSDLYAQNYTEAEFQKLDTHFRKVEDGSIHWKNTDELGIDRNRKASNWNALKRHGTFEYRAFGSTLNSELLQIEHNLIQSIVRAVRLRSPKLLQLLKTVPVSELNLQKIAVAVDAFVAEPTILARARGLSALDVFSSRKIQSKLQHRHAPLAYPELSVLISAAHPFMRITTDFWQQQSQLPIRTNRCVGFYTLSFR